MAKKHPSSSTPKKPKRMEHYRASFDETTPEGLEAILAESKDRAMHTFKKYQSDLSKQFQSNYGKRRRDAIRRTFPSIINHRGLTEKTRGLFTAAEIWSTLNHCTRFTLESVDVSNYLLLAASVWLLDHIKNAQALIDILSGVDWTMDPDRPYIYDLRFGEDMIDAVTFVLRHRTDSDHYMLDVNPGRGPTADAFDRLLALVPPEDLRRAVAHLRALFWSSVDQFYDIECALAERCMKGVEKYDALVDRYNDNLERFLALVEKRESELAARKKPNNVLTKPAIQLPQPPVLSPIQPLGLDPFPPGSPFASFAPDFDDAMRRSETLCQMIGSIEKQHEAITDAFGDMLVTGLDFGLSGLMGTDRYLTEGIPPVTPPAMADPYEICAALLLLCSEEAYCALYADIPGASPQKDLDLPWLQGAMMGMLADVHRCLPWGAGDYAEDEIPFSPPSKPIAHTDWNAPTLEDRQSLAQVVYLATGVILPRTMNDFDNLKSYLWKLGIRGKATASMVEFMSILEAVQFREELPADPLPDDPAEEHAEDIDALKTQVKALQERLKKATDAVHVQDRRARKAEADLAAERERAEADRKELAGLREVIFTADHRDDDHISVTLPYEVQGRTLIFGGHDMWQKPMKDFLTGHVRFIDRDMVAFDTDVIRNTEAVWIQTNAISHKMYYRIMDAARKWKIPVKYFLYASARKCAEQIALDERN